MSHRLRITGSTDNVTEGWRRISIACDVPGCLSGQIRAAPPSAVDDLFVFVRQHHLASCGSGGPTP